MKGPFYHFLIHSSPKKILRSAKNVVFSLFYILVHRPMGGRAVASYPLAKLLKTAMIVAQRQHSYLTALFKMLNNSGKICYLDYLKCLYCNSSVITVGITLVGSAMKAYTSFITPKYIENENNFKQEITYLYRIILIFFCSIMI